MSNSSSHFTEATTNYWQEILPSHPIPGPPYKFAYPVSLPGGNVLMLPIRQSPTKPNEAVASLLTTHAAIDVADKLGEYLAEKVKEEYEGEIEVIVGLPTLGLSVARIVAMGLGLKRYIPLGYSRKFWYDDNLSTSVTSITSPSYQKKIYLDPNNLPLLKGKKVLIIDDAVSSGNTLKKSWDLLESKAVGAEVVGAGVIMKQGENWRDSLGPEREDKLVWVFDSPLLRKVERGWEIR